MSYERVMKLAREHPYRPHGDFTPDWLMVVRGCYEETKGHEGKIFDGSSVVDRLRFLPGFENRIRWFPGLSLLQKYGILKKVGRTIQGGRKANWVMPDINGVARALRELRYLG